MADPLKATDHWCPHKWCPYIGPERSCNDCRAEYLRKLEENKCETRQST